MGGKWTMFERLMRALGLAAVLGLAGSALAAAPQVGQTLNGQVDVGLAKKIPLPPGAWKVEASFPVETPLTGTTEPSIALTTLVLWSLEPRPEILVLVLEYSEFARINWRGQPCDNATALAQNAALLADPLGSGANSTRVRCNRLFPVVNFRNAVTQAPSSKSAWFAGRFGPLAARAAQFPVTGLELRGYASVLNGDKISWWAYPNTALQGLDAGGVALFRSPQPPGPRGDAATAYMVALMTWGSTYTQAIDSAYLAGTGPSVVPRLHFDSVDPRLLAAAPTAAPSAAPSTSTPPPAPAVPAARPLAESAAASLRNCAARLVITLADGSRTCLADHNVAALRSSSAAAGLAQAIPNSGVFHIAVAAAAGRCPAAVGLSASKATYSSAGENAPEVRALRALGECQAAMRAAGAAPDCNCTILASDGSSSLGPDAFAVLASLKGSTLATLDRPEPSSLPKSAASPAVVPAAPAAGAALAQNATSTPSATTGPAATTAARPAPALTAGTPLQSPPRPAAPAPAVAAATPTQAVPAALPNPELVALRMQLESLQAQVTRQQDSAATRPAVAPAPPVAPVAPRLRARALIIGNGKYAQLGTLPNPANDARAIGDKLRKFGIEVDLVLDADRPALVRALGEYQSRAAGYDVNIFFYAGHGLQVDGINYIVPVDMSGAGATAGSVKLNAVSLNDALEYLPARTRLVFLDACRDNPLSRSLRASRSGSGSGLAPVNTMSGTLVAYATKDGSIAEDGHGRNSPYTEALLRHLDAEEDIAIVLRRVRQAVLQATDKRQEPWEYGSLIGDQLILSRLAR